MAAPAEAYVKDGDFDLPSNFTSIQIVRDLPQPGFNVTNYGWQASGTTRTAIEQDRDSKFSEAFTLHLAGRHADYARANQTRSANGFYAFVQRDMKTVALESIDCPTTREQLGTNMPNVRILTEDQYHRLCCNSAYTRVPTATYL